MPQQPFGAGMQVPPMCFFYEPSSKGIVDFYLLSVARRPNESSGGDRRAGEIGLDDEEAGD
jgi:hypothetical protein